MFKNIFIKNLRFRRGVTRTRDMSKLGTFTIMAVRYNKINKNFYLTVRSLSYTANKIFRLPLDSNLVFYNVF